MRGGKREAGEQAMWAPAVAVLGVVLLAVRGGGDLQPCRGQQWPAGDGRWWRRRRDLWLLVWWLWSSGDCVHGSVVATLLAWDKDRGDSGGG